MNKSIDIYADIVLSFNGEDILINASDDTLTISAPSIGSALRTLININEHYNIEKHGKLDALLKRERWTVYANSGRFKMAILGYNSSSKLLPFLMRLARFGKRVVTI